MVSIGFNFSGGIEIERALAALPRSTSKAVARRAMKQALKPVQATAQAMGPFRIAISPRLSKRQAKLARQMGSTSLTSMHVGPTKDDGTHAPHAHLIEFGTGPRYAKEGPPMPRHYETPKFVGAVSPDPFMRPAWDMHRAAVLETLGELMWAEIQKTVARRAARAAAS